MEFYSARELTLVGIAVGALVGLWTVVTLVQTLVTAVDSDSVVGSQVPSLLSRTRVGLPDLGVHVVALGHTGIEGKVGAREDDGTSSGVDVPS